MGLLHRGDLAQLGQLFRGRGHIALGQLPLAVAHHADLAVVETLGGLGLLLQPYLHGLLEQVDLRYGAHPLRGLHKGLVLGHAAHRVLIGLLLVFQAAHEPSAGARNLGGVEGQVLGFGHLDGHRLKLVQEGGAAEGLAADAQAAQHFGLVPDADLPQLNAGVEYPSQILDQSAEVHPPLGGEEKEDLVPLKVVLHLHQLHIQAMGGDLLLADGKGPRFLLTVLRHGVQILLGGQADQGAQRLYHRLVLHHGVALGTLAVLQAAGGLDNDPLTGGHGLSIGVKIILFASAFEADADDFGHDYLRIRCMGGVGPARS